MFFRESFSILWYNLATEQDIKELDLKIEAIKNEIVIKLGGIVVGTGGIILLFMKLFRI